METELRRCLLFQRRSGIGFIVFKTFTRSQPQASYRALVKSLHQLYKVTFTRGGKAPSPTSAGIPAPFPPVGTCAYTSESTYDLAMCMVYT